MIRNVLRLKTFCNCSRNVSSKRGMKAWVVERFGGDMQMKDIAEPEITAPNQILLRVKAASVNPIDTVMRNGYGDRLFSALKQVKSCSCKPVSRLPFIGGRDCSGVVEMVGGNVTDFKPGDEVIAVIDPLKPGSHAEFVVAEESSCAHKPKNVSSVEATCMPYTACTSWAALVSTARINPKNASEQRVLIHGGAGGIGTTAIQMLKAWNVGKIVATCSKDSFDLVRRLGAVPIDYREPQSLELLISEGPFDVILDCVDSELASWSDKVLGKWRNCVHVTIVSPLMSDTDKYGLLQGLASVATKLLTRALMPALRDGQLFMYAFFAPSKECLEQISTFLENGKMKAIIDKVYDFDQAPAAYNKVSKLKGRGKTVINFESLGGIKMQNSQK